MAPVLWRADFMSTKLPNLSLEQFIALNDELTALARAGVPLEKGLCDVGRDLPGRLGVAAQTLGQRLAAGENLAQILAEDSGAFPPEYRAAVLAGLRAGRLSAALEGVASTARRTAELRRVVGAALLYPLLIVSLTYVLFAFMATTAMPRIAGVMEDFEISDGGLSAAVVSLGRLAAWFLPVVALVIPVIAAAWWLWSGRVAWIGDRSGRGFFGRFPSAGALLRARRLATFADMLALMVEQQTPLKEAVLLAAQACGDRRLQRASCELAERLEAGGLGEDWRAPRDFPPLVGWLVLSGERNPNLSRALRAAADRYRRQALRLADWLTTYLSTILTAGVGGVAVAVYMLLVLGPYIRILHGLSHPN